MSLTGLGGPFGVMPQGTFNFTPDLPAGFFMYFEDTARRVRVVLNGQTVADSTRAKMLHLSRSLPGYYFPRADVRTDSLVESQRRDHDPNRGDIQFWSVKVGDRLVEDAAWEHVAPPASAEFLRGFVSFDFAGMDAWFEEDEQVLIHPRDPYHRVDVRTTNRHERVLRDGVVLADTNHAKVLFETGLPPRYYIPPNDVVAQLVPSDHHTRCAYKGVASYWSVQTGESVVPNLIWYYPEPWAEAAEIEGLLAFYDERVDVEIDGELRARPQTPWSKNSDPPVPMVGTRSASI